MFPAVNTLYNALLNGRRSKSCNFPTCASPTARHGDAKGGGRPLVGRHRCRLSRATASRDVTVRHLQPDGHRCLPGTIGLPLPSTEIAIPR